MKVRIVVDCLAIADVRLTNRDGFVSALHDALAAAFRPVAHQWRTDTPAAVRHERVVSADGLRLNTTDNRLADGLAASVASGVMATNAGGHR